MQIKGKIEAILAYLEGLKTSGTAPVTSGTTKVVIVDADGLLSFDDAAPGGSGYSGYSGKSGYSGYSSASGYSGYSSSSGYSGYTGISGYSAYSGKSGYSGYTGYSGYSGGGGVGDVTTTGVQTLTNKRITKRVQSVSNAATVTPSADSDDCVDITAIAQAFTIANATGTPTNMQTLIIRILDNSVARAITWESAYVDGGVALPPTTVAGKIHTIGFVYDTANSLNKWLCVSSIVQP
jgi:hypothetical protein